MDARIALPAAAAAAVALLGFAAVLWARHGADVFLASLAAPLLDCF